MNKVHRPKYHPKTGIELASSDCLMENGLVRDLLRDKEILLDTNSDMRAKVEKLTQKNEWLQMRLSHAETENEKLKNSKAIGSAFQIHKKRFLALKRILEATSSNESYEKLDRDIRVCSDISK